MLNQKRYWGAVFSALLLTACGSNPSSYLPIETKPIVNVEAQIAEVVEVKACPEKLSLTNLSEMPLAVAYKLFWYDKNGVTQTFNDDEVTAWQKTRLEPKQYQMLNLTKPTAESVNYRVYLRSER